MRRTPLTPPTPRPEDPSVVMERARQRASIVVVGVVLGYVLLALRAVPLMLLHDPKLEAKASEQFRRSVEVQAPRGDIYARDGSLLATTVRMPSLHVDPSRFAQHDIDPAVLAADLAPLISTLEEPVDAASLTARIDDPHRRDVTIAARVSPDLLPRIEALAPADVLWTRDELARYYPGRELATQVLGVVGHTGSGLEGVEREYNRQLKGATYRYVQQRDRRGRAISTADEARSRAQEGDSLTLTLDPYIQRAAEDALDEVMERSDPLAATAVVVDVKTGEILAVANRPTTNPNDRRGREIANLRNHAAADLYEPGSVLKPFIVAVALEEGTIEADALVDCEGGNFAVGRNVIHDDHPHEMVTLSEVVKYSSNIGVAKLAFELGAERVMEGLRRFGFAARSGVDLPAEAGGFLRSPKQIRPIELATTAFGQGMTSTPLQLAMALATLGNDGVRMKPFVVREVRDRLGYVQAQQRPERVERAVSAEVADTLVAFMATVLEEGGTGTRARIPGYTAAGKTGTAQKVVDGHYSPTARVSSFIGLAPATEPRIAIIVQVDTPRQGSRYGGTVSGPVFSHIGGKALRYLGVPEDAPDEVEPIEVSEDDSLEGEVVVDAELTWTTNGQLQLPDFTGLSMRDLLAAVDGSGLELSLQGSGRVVAQAPAPGQPLSPGERLEVKLQ
ncbi:MAG: transpeptidase family protein [Alphaproteobacteria bacterium]|nr:transpeptidase family protein [Alphaproteobacteria bacterium]